MGDGGSRRETKAQERCLGVGPQPILQPQCRSYWRLVRALWGNGVTWVPPSAEALPTYTSSSQLRGFSMRYPWGSFSYSSAHVIPQYGVPPTARDTRAEEVTVPRVFPPQSARITRPTGTCMKAGDREEPYPS